MARYEHLPIYRAAFDLAVHLEKIVRNFSRYHRYSLGTELRAGSRRILESMQRTVGWQLRQTRRAVTDPGAIGPHRFSSLPLMHLTRMYEVVGDERALSDLYPDRYTTPPDRTRSDSLGRQESRAMLRRARSISMSRRINSDELPPSARGNFRNTTVSTTEKRIWR